MQSHKCRKGNSWLDDNTAEKIMEVYSERQTKCEPAVQWYGKMAELVLGGISNGSVGKPWEAIISLWSLLGCAGGEAGLIWALRIREMQSKRKESKELRKNDSFRKCDL